MTEDSKASKEPTTLHDRTPLLSPAPWKKWDYYLVLLLGLIKFGDSVEVYLPGVITQLVSCELEVSPTEEGFLGVVLYATLAAAIMVAAALSERFGRRPIILASLYTSIVSTVVCALIPNYYTLLLSRALIGMCVGLNKSTSGVYFAEHVSTRNISVFGTFIANLLYSAGGAWVAVLGYLFLERLGWRVFVLLTSIPLFIPPIALLQCVFSTAQVEMSPGGDMKEPLEVQNFKLRTLKSSALSFICHMQGYCIILLLPALLQLDNERGQGADANHCETVVRGTQFLVLALVSGGANLAGRALGYFMSKRFRFRPLQMSLAIVIALSYGSLILDLNIGLAVLGTAAVKLCYSMMMIEIALMTFDPNYFGTATFALGSGITLGSGMLGAVCGITLAAFLTPHVVVICMCVFSLVQVAVVCSVTER